MNHKIIDYYRKKINQTTNLDKVSASKYFDEHQAWHPEQAPKNWEDDENNLLDDDEFQAVLKMCMDALPEKWNSCVN